MTILITGAHGFVGKHVVSLLQQGEEHILTPTSRELDLLSHDEFSTVGTIESYLHDNNVDAIVHLAAVCGGIGINKDNPGKFIYENLQMGVNILEAARRSGVRKVVNLGTVCAYPKHATVPFQEEDIWNGYPEETNAPYGIAKKTIMEMGRAYSKQYGLDVTNLVPVNMAGEFDHFDLYSSHVIPALIRKFEEAEFVSAEQMQRDAVTNPDANPRPVEHYRKFEGRQVVLWGDGLATREFLYAGDCARAIALSLTTNTGPEPINLGTGRETSITALAEMVKEIGNYDVKILWDVSKPNGQPRRCLDVSRAKKILGWEAETSLEETIRRTIEWYRTNG